MKRLTAPLPGGPATITGVSSSGSTSAAANAAAYEGCRSCGCMTVLHDGVAAVEDRLRRGGLGFEDRPVGDVAVPFDQGWNRAAPRDHDLEQFPDGIRDRTVMAVDQQQVALVVGLFCMTGEMNLADTGQRKIGQIVQRRETVIGRGHEDVVDVE